MIEEHSNEARRGDDWIIYPLFHLDADWDLAEPRYFDLGLCLMRAGERELEQLSQIPHDAPLILETAAYNPEYGLVRWLLAAPLHHATQDVSAREIGVDFQAHVQKAIVNSFLTCLKVIRATPVSCPLSYRSRICAGQVDVSEVYAAPDFDATIDVPGCYWPERLQTEDLDVLDLVWSGLVKVRQLHRWTQVPFQEKFFANLDQAAVQSVDTRLRGLLRDKGLEDSKINDLLAGFRKLDIWEDGYREAFTAEFRRQEDRTFNAETRLGRALGVFEEGVHLPELHAFLSMCLVWEILLSDGKGEVTHKLATRLAKLLGEDSNLDERKDLFRRAKKAYGARSDVVHGRKSIAAVEEVKRDVFLLARDVLRKILCNARYRRVFSTASEQELDEFFKALDLG